MEDIAQPIHEVVRSARRAQGLTQSELARETGCTQSAISMFESGRQDALSRKTIERVTGRLGIEAPPPVAPSEDPRHLTELRYCPVDDCPSNVPYVVRGELHFKPVLVEVRADTPAHCVMCGEILERCCPNASCGAPVVEGGRCHACGAAYVPTTRALRGPLDQWVVSRRSEIREIREMTRTKQFGT